MEELFIGLPVGRYTIVHSVIVVFAHPYGCLIVGVTKYQCLPEMQILECHLTMLPFKR
jgi:hypothetical protein